MFLVLALVSVVMLFPFFWMVVSAFKSPAELREFPPTVWPREATLDNFRAVLRMGHFGRWYLNSAIVAVSVTLSSCLFCSLSGFALAKLRFPGRQVAFVLILSTLMIPMQMLIIPWYLISVRYNLVNTYFGIMFPGLLHAFGVFMMRQFIATIPDSMIESARVDGANELSIYWHVILPLVRPALAALAILTFLGNWDAFLWPLIVTDDVEMRTLPVALQAFGGQFGTEYHKIMAAATLVVIPALVFFIVLQTQILRGVKMSGLTK